MFGNNKKIVFEFTEEERELALREANRRYDYNQERGIKGRDGGPSVGEVSLLINKIGTGGEMAVASYLGLKDVLFMEEGPVRGSFDIPPNIDVKATLKHRYNLILKVEDNPEFVYVLVTFEDKECIIWGWIKGENGKIDKYYTVGVTRRPSYLVPKSALRPISELKTILN